MSTVTFFQLRFWPGSAARSLACLCWLLGSLLLTVPAWAQGSTLTHEASTAKPTGSSTNHKLLLCTNGAVLGIGSNYSGELANGTPVGGATTTFVTLSMPVTMVRVVAVSQVSFGIDTNGNLWSWGDNSDGLLGVGSTVSSTATPMQVPGISRVVAVSGGFRFAVALCSDGTVWSWGYGGDGSLGTGGTPRSIVYTPQQLPTSSFNNVPIRAIASGDQFTLALDSEHHVWSWGIDGFGELGIFATRPSNIVQDVPAQLNLNDVRQVEATNARSAAVLTNGDVYVWGNNTGGQLGLNNTSYVGTPKQVPGLPSVVSIALNIGSTIAVLPTGGTYVWGDNNFGQLAITSTTFAAMPLVGPTFSEGVQITGQVTQFTSIERTGIVKTWGDGCLGYTPSAPTPPSGGSYSPTTPSGICLSVPVSDFPGCGPLRAFYQNSDANYIAVNHGYTVSPAEIGQPGVLTTIDVSRAPYNGQLTFSGVYHVLGDVKFINGTVDFAARSTFWIDGPGGTYSDYRKVSIQVENATLQLRSATLRAHCDDLWGGILVLKNGTLRSLTSRVGFLTLGSTIRDSFWGVWAVDPTSHYTLTRATFLNNHISVSDGNRTNILTGEGITGCVFRIDAGAGGPLANSYWGLYSSYGILFGDASYSSTATFGDFGRASFSTNTFDGLYVGISGTAGNATFANNTFTNCWYAAAASTSIPNINGQPTTQPMVFSGNTINIPANFPAGYTTNPGVTAYGIAARLDHNLTSNLIQVAPATSGVASRRVGVSLIYGGTVEKTRFAGLDVGIEATSGEWYLDYLHGNSSSNTTGTNYTFTSNTFTYPATQAEGISFLRAGYSYGRFAPVTVACNSFDGSAGTAYNTTGIWVKSGTAFPSTLANPNSASGANGNDLSSLVDIKRFVYEGTASNFIYLRYNSSQEVFVGRAGNSIYDALGSTITASATNTLASGVNACGNSSGPGVYNRATTTTSPASQTATAQLLGAAYPNPASETLTFTYKLPAEGEAVLVLRNLMGQAVIQQPLPDQRGEITISVHALSAGFYTAALEVNGHSQQAQKVTIAR